MEFPLNSIQSRANEGRDDCCGTAAPSVGSQLPASTHGRTTLWVTRGKRRCIPTSPHFRALVCGTNPERSPATCFLPPPLPPGELGRAQGNSLDSSFTQAPGEHRPPGHPPMSLLLSCPPQAFPSFHNTGITKLHRLTGRWQEARWVPPSSRDPGKPLDMSQARAATHRFSSPAQGQRSLSEGFQVLQKPAAEKALPLCRGVGR